jgi:predicted dithiol-disulfide oxidoreductase (DUF899 family)
LNRAPLGRQEDWEDSPEGYPKTERYKWWRWHDTVDQEDAGLVKTIENGMEILNL